MLPQPQTDFGQCRELDESLSPSLLAKPNASRAYSLVKQYKKMAGWMLSQLIVSADTASMDHMESCATDGERDCVIMRTVTKFYFNRKEGK